MAGTLKVIAPTAFLTGAAANIYTPPASTMYIAIRQIHIANVTAGAVTYTLYRGLTGGSAAGTELAKGVSVAANSVADLYFPSGLVMLSTDFLSGLASAVSSLTITVLGEQYVTP